MAQALGPWALAKSSAKLPGSALMMKLMSPCRCRVTFLRLCLATAGKPILVNSERSSSRIGRGIFDELEAVGAHRVFEAQRALFGDSGGHGLISLFSRLSLRLGASLCKTARGELTPPFVDLDFTACFATCN